MSLCLGKLYMFYALSFYHKNCASMPNWLLQAFYNKRDSRQATSGIFYSKYHNLVYKSWFLVTSSGLTSHRSAVMYSLSQNKVNLFLWFIQKDLTSVAKSVKFFLRLALDIRSNIILLYGGHFMTFTHSDKCQTQFERYFLISTIHDLPTASILTCSY